MSQTEQSAGTGVDTRMMKALSHPLRWRILEHLTAGPASPSMVAARLGEPLGNVSYHVKILLQHDAIELVETRPVRGALEHVYRAVGGAHDARGHVSWTSLDLDQQAYDELTDTLAMVLDRARELHAETAGRAGTRKGGPAELHETELAIFHLHRPAAQN